MCILWSKKENNPVLLLKNEGIFVRNVSFCAQAVLNASRASFSFDEVYVWGLAISKST